MNFLCWFIDEWRMISDIWNIHKATNQEALVFYMFRCFNISKHISISVLFCIISVSCFVFFSWIFENNCLGGGILARFFCPRGRGFALSLCPGVANSPFQKNSPGVGPGGWSGLELTDTLIKELGNNISNTTNISPNSTYIPSTDSFDEILKSNCKFIESVGLKMSEEDKSLPYLYWTPKLHKVAFKHHFIREIREITK